MFAAAESGRGRIVMAIHRPSKELLCNQISSLRAQTLADWTCLSGVDGSDEGAVDLLIDLIDGDRRFIVTSFDDNVGVYRHFERLLSLTPHDAAWVALCDQDDVWYPDKLARLVKDLDSKGAAAAMGRARLTDPSGLPLGVAHRLPGGVVDNLLRNQVTGSMTVLRTEVLHAALPFPTATRIAMHDHWLGTCAAAVGIVHERSQIVQDYVQHDGNVLGEIQRPSWKSKLGLRSKVGLRARFDVMVIERWGWRVSMAAALEERALVAPDLAVVHAIADGRATLQLFQAVARGVLSRRLDVRRATGILVCALCWKGANRRRVNVV